MALTIRDDAVDYLGSSYGITAADAITEMTEELQELEPKQFPLTTLLMHPDFNKKSVQSAKVEWREHENLPISTTTNSNDSGTGTATSIVAATGTGVYFRPGDLLRMESTGEIMRVTARSTDTLTVARGIGNGGTGVEWGSTDGLTIVRCSHASAQMAGLPEIRMVNSVALYNYTQIFRDPYGMSRTVRQTKQYGGDPMARERKTKMLEHKRAIELALFVGKRDTATDANNRPITIMGGIGYYVTANITTIGGNLTAANMKSYLRDVTRYGSSRIFAFGSPMVTQAISTWTEGKMALSKWEDGKKYGVDAREFTWGGNTLIMVEKKNWNGLPTTSPGLGGSLYLVDMDALELCTLQPTIHLDNRQAPDIDGTKNEWLTELSLRVFHGGSGGAGNGKHGLLRGITGVA